MVKLEEVMDEEFVREQEGPHDDDEWDTDSGTKRAKPLHLISMLPLPLPLPLSLFFRQNNNNVHLKFQFFLPGK